MDSNKVIATDSISEEAWVTEPGAALPDHLHECARHGILPPELLHLKVRVGIREWPAGHEQHLMARLGASLLEIMREGGTKLGISVLPPGADIQPLDALLFLKRGEHWSDPIADLHEPLWLAIVHGDSRHFGIEFKLVVQINTKWAVASSANLTPKQLLEAFGFSPSEYSLYHANSSELLPPDVPLNLKRGDRFEAQKDGRYGAPVGALPSIEEMRPIERDVVALTIGGYEARLFSQNGQEYIEVSNVDVPSPPWSSARARILIAVPATYPAGGLDAFYLDRSSLAYQGGAIPYEQARATIDGREWGLMSWHYAVNRPWNPTHDSLSSHIAHCRGYFLRRGVAQ